MLSESFGEGLSMFGFGPLRGLLRLLSATTQLLLVFRLELAENGGVISFKDVERSLVIGSSPRENTFMLCTSALEELGRLV